MIVQSPYKCVRTARNGGEGRPRKENVANLRDFAVSTMSFT